MNSKYLPGILAMAPIVVASNILVQFLFGQWLTWGAFTYPLGLSRHRHHEPRLWRGRRAARRLRGLSRGCRLLADRGTQIMGEFGPLVTLRIALGSGLAFLTAQLLDVAIFDRMRGRSGGKPLSYL
jgi:uncharacterized PurR-regulated membrane protein YhhQ (DUF165 family)